MTGSELTRLRRRLSMTEAKLAWAIGMNTESVVLMERGEKPILRATAVAVRLLLLKKRAARFVSRLKRAKRPRRRPRRESASLAEMLPPRRSKRRERR